MVPASDSTSPTESWRQGDLLTAQAAVRLLDDRGRGLCEDEIAIVISHDCDLATKDTVNEPSVEVVIARLVGDDPDGGLTYGKNPRRLQIELTGGDRAGWYEMVAADRFMLDRSQFAGDSPDRVLTLDKESIEILALWLAGRYRRSAFPDSFNDRAKPAGSRIKRVLKSSGKRVSGIYLVADFRELPANETYATVLVATMPVKFHRESGEREASEVAVARIASALNACEGIDITDYALRAEDHVSLDDLRYLKRFDTYDSLSNSQDEGELTADR